MTRNQAECDGLEFLCDDPEYREVMAMLPRPVEPSKYDRPAMTPCEITGDPS